MSRKPPAGRKAGGLQSRSGATDRLQIRSGESVQCRSGESLVQADLEILLDKGKDLGTSHKFKRLIDNQFRKDGAPKSVFLWRLGSNMCRITGHTDRCRVDFAKLIAPKFFVVRC